MTRSMRAGHLPALDGLRGCAILLVLAYHFLHLDGLEQHPADRAVLAVARAGWCGVDLFFVLSGFLITGILLDAKGSPGWLRAFWIRRMLRIFPLHYLYLTGLFVVLPLLAPHGGQVVPAKVQAWFWGYAGNVMFALRGTFDGGPALAAHFWSLAVEEQFYLAWPLVVAAVSRRALGWTCLTLILVAALLRAALVLNGGHANAAYVLTPCRMDALAMGGLLAVLARRADGWALARRAAPGVALVSAACIVLVSIWRGALFGGDPMVEAFAFTPLAFFFGAVLVLAIGQERTRLGRVLEVAPLRALGRYSYGLYVLHYPVLRGLEARGFRATALPAISGSRLPGLVVFAIVAGALSFAAALASWHAVERRCLALKDRVRHGRKPVAVRA